MCYDVMRIYWLALPDFLMLDTPLINPLFTVVSKSTHLLQGQETGLWMRISNSMRVGLMSGYLFRSHACASAS